MAVTYQPPPFKLEPPGYFTRIYFYNHARRLRLEKLLYLESFWAQVAVSEVKKTVIKPFRKLSGYKFITARGGLGK
jgi:hypothetical protein